MGAGTEDRPFLTPAVWLLDFSEHTPSPGPHPRATSCVFLRDVGMDVAGGSRGLRQCRQCPGNAWVTKGGWGDRPRGHPRGAQGTDFTLSKGARPRGLTPALMSGAAAKRSYPASEVMSSGCTLLE